MPRDTLYPEDELLMDEEAGYYPIAFDDPDAEGVRYPIAIPRGGSFQPPPTIPEARPDFSPNGGRYLPGSENLTALPGGGYNQAYAAEELKRQQEGDPVAVQQAIRLQGLRKYQKLVADGASNSEALRLSAPELYFNHPQATALATRDVPQLRTPTISQIPIKGGTALFVDDKYRTTLREPRPQMPPDVRFQIGDVSSEIQDIQRQIRDARDPLKGALLSPADKTKLETRLKELQSSRMNLSTNWQDRITPPPAETKKLTKEIAADLLRQAKGDKELARKLARDAGYEF